MNETNMQLYNAVSEVPKEAQREITAGRLKGKTDINPMWRIRTLTKHFGPAGIGWWTETLERWVDRNELTGEATANIRILLYVNNFNGENHPIEGIGGAMLIANEKGGQFTDDEAWKKAYTDAISVACKALGMGANIYWKEGATKYTARPAAQDAQNAQRQPEAGKDTPKAQTAEKTQPASQNERPNVMDDNYYHRILEELLTGTGVTMVQLDAICQRDMGGKHIEELDEHERKKFYVDTKTGIMKIKGGKA